MTFRSLKVVVIRFDGMLGNYNDGPLETITKHLERLGISTAFIAGAAAVAKYSDRVLPACPVAAKIIDIVLVFVGLFLIVWVGFGAWAGLVNRAPGRIWYQIGGFVFLLVAILVGLGGTFAAISA